MGWEWVSGWIALPHPCITYLHTHTHMYTHFFKHTVQHSGGALNECLLPGFHESLSSAALPEAGSSSWRWDWQCGNTSRKQRIHSLSLCFRWSTQSCYAETTTVKKIWGRHRLLLLDHFQMLLCGSHLRCWCCHPRLLSLECLDWSSKIWIFSCERIVA